MREGGREGSKCARLLTKGSCGIPAWLAACRLPAAATAPRCNRSPCLACPADAVRRSRRGTAGKHLMQADFAYSGYESEEDSEPKGEAGGVWDRWLLNAAWKLASCALLLVGMVASSASQLMLLACLLVFCTGCPEIAIVLAALSPPPLLLQPTSPFPPACPADDENSPPKNGKTASARNKRTAGKNDMEAGKKLGAGAKVGQYSSTAQPAMMPRAPATPAAYNV